MPPSLAARFFITILGASLAFSAAACSGSGVDDASLAASKLAVKKGKDGAPTGDGKTCSWHGSGWAIAAGGSVTGEPSSPVGDCVARPDGSGTCAPSPPPPPPDTRPTPLPEPYPMPEVEEYRIGDWFSSPDGCNRCTCTAIGIMCTVQICEVPPYPGPDPLPPPPPGGGCEIEGKPIPAGSSVRAPDGCNACTCTKDGHLACTEMACGAPAPKQ